MQPPNQLSKGFFTFAQNTDKVDYIRLAYGLALSLKHTQGEISNLSIGISNGTVVDDRYAWIFDKIIEIPWGDDAKNSDWKLQNEWKSIWMTPYDETIKLDCDMLFFSDISHWWDMLNEGVDDIVFANTVLNWRGSPIVSDYYRKTFTINNLPNIYTGFNYFRKTQYSFNVFKMAKIIFWNWEKFFEKYLHYDERPTFPSTDVIFALVMKFLDEDQYSYKVKSYPTFTHMKSRLQGWKTDPISEDWKDHLSVFFTPLGECNLGNHKQVYPLHYHLKDFLTNEMIDYYEKLVKDV